jgi:hypothetical protein
MQNSVFNQMQWHTKYVYDYYECFDNNTFIISNNSNPAGTSGYRNATESFFRLKGRPSVVRDVLIHNQPVVRMRRK